MAASFLSLARIAIHIRLNNLRLDLRKNKTLQNFFLRLFFWFLSSMIWLRRAHGCPHGILGSVDVVNVETTPVTVNC